MLEKRMSRIFPLLLGLLLCTPVLPGQTILSADGRTDTYTLITKVLGAGPEVPDCGHGDFGPHITQAMDGDLGKYVFQFHSHAKLDNDRCINFDRQRNEIKAAGSSPAAVKAFAGDTMNFRWRFKLDAGFQPTRMFTHVHQIKAGDGNAGAPLITYTPNSGNVFRVGYFPDAGPSVTLARADLRPFLGAWVEANETVTFAEHGSLAITITRISDGKVLLAYNNPDINLLRSRTTFYRPKWGIYRSLRDPGAMRDETVLFDQFCIAKAPLVCPDGLAAKPVGTTAGTRELPKTTPDFSLAASPAALTVTAGGKTTFEVAVNLANGFKGDVLLSAAGLAPGIAARFNRDSVRKGAETARLTLTTDSSTTIDKHTISITGTSGNVTHTVTVTLIVKPVSKR